MTRARVVAVLKALWLVAVLTGVSYYLFRHRGAMQETWRSVHWPSAVVALVVLVAAKGVLAQSARLSLRVSGFETEWWRAARMYSVSQLGKYAPGGIWHFVGRFSMYRLVGAERGQASVAMLLENAWLLAGAAFVGLIAIWPQLLQTAGVSTGLTSPTSPWWIAGSSLLVAAWFAAAHASQWVARTSSRSALVTLQVICLQSLVWIAVGACLWITLPDQVRDLVSLRRVIGAFALGWAAGYVAVFAPAGFGVREAVTFALLRDVIPTHDAVAFGAINRLVWTVAELGLGLAFLASPSAPEPIGASPAVPGADETS